MPSITVNVTTPTSENKDFIVSGSLIAYSASPSLMYRDNQGSWNNFPQISRITLSNYSFLHPKTGTTGEYTISVKDADNSSIIGSQSFTVPVVVEPSAPGDSISGPSLTPIIDSDFNSFNITTSSFFGNQVTINGITDTTTANVVRLFVNDDDEIYYENIDGNFFVKLTTSNVWQQTSDPQTITIKACTIETPSNVIANTSFVVKGTLEGYSLAPILEFRDNNGNWNNFPTNGNTTNTSFQFLHPGVIQQDGFTISVRDKNLINISATTFEISIVNSPESAEGTSLQPLDNQSIVDSLGNFWSLTSDGYVVLNAVIDYTTSRAKLLYYSNRTIFYQNIDQSWFKKPNMNSQWLLTTSPYLNSPTTEAFKLAGATQSVNFLVTELQSILTILRPSIPID